MLDSGKNSGAKDMISTSINLIIMKCSRSLKMLVKIIQSIFLRSGIERIRTTDHTGLLVIPLWKLPTAYNNFEYTFWLTNFLVNLFLVHLTIKILEAQIEVNKIDKLIQNRPEICQSKYVFQIPLCFSIRTSYVMTKKPKPTLFEKLSSIRTKLRLKHRE